MIQDIAPKKFHNEYHPEIRPKSGDPVFHFRGRDVLISSEPEKPWPSFCEFQNEEQVVYIFSIDEQHYFMLLDDEADVPDKYTYRDVRTVRSENRLEGHETFAAFTALHLNSWYRANRFCGSCGGKTEPDTVERAMKCKDCGRVIYPRIKRAEDPGADRGLHRDRRDLRGVCCQRSDGRSGAEGEEYPLLQIPALGHCGRYSRRLLLRRGRRRYHPHR